MDPLTQNRRVTWTFASKPWGKTLIINFIIIIIIITTIIIIIIVVISFVGPCLCEGYACPFSFYGVSAKLELIKPAVTCLKVFCFFESWVLTRKG